MEIGEGKLQDLLNQRQKYIKSNTDIITSGIALASYIVTMSFSFMGIEKIPAYALIIGFMMLLFYIV